MAMGNIVIRFFLFLIVVIVNLALGSILFCHYDIKYSYNYCFMSINTDVYV